MVRVEASVGDLYDVAMSLDAQTPPATDLPVVSNPRILGGRPVFRDTRVPVAILFDYLADGLSLDYFLETFPTVTREQAVAVLRHGEQLVELEPTP